MELKIITNGDSKRTSIFINGVKQEKINELTFTVRAMKKCKMNIKCKGPDGAVQFLSYFADDFEKFDSKPEKEDCYVGENGEQTREQTASNIGDRNKSDNPAKQ